MGRRLGIAAVVLLLASLPVAAQHGGGHSGGSVGHAGFSGSAGHVSGGMHSGAAHSSPGMSRGFAHAPSVSQRAFSHPPVAHGGSHSTHVHIQTFGFRNNCVGFGCRGRYLYPYAYGGFYDPYWWWNSGSSNYDADYERNRAVANEMNQQSLEEQQMRRQQDAEAVDPDPYANSARSLRPPQSEAEQGTPIIPATVLVFRDQHKQEIHNYAIVGQTLWSFGSPRTEKIPLTDLDLAATTKANDDRGLTFRLPATGEAQ